jgi:hypothetical protein
MLSHRGGFLVAVGGMAIFLIFTTTLLSAMRPISLEHMSPSRTHHLKSYTVPMTIQPLLHIEEPSDDNLWTIQNRTLGVSSFCLKSLKARSD